MHPSTVVLAATGTLWCALSGCGANVGVVNLPTVSKRALQEDISERLAKAGEEPESVTCNEDLVGDMRVAVPTSEQYSVFRSYLDSRHRDGGMADMTVLDYAMMVEDSHVETRVVEYRRRGPDSSINRRGTGALLAVALTDVLNDGLSMVY